MTDHSHIINESPDIKNPRNLRLNGDETGWDALYFSISEGKVALRVARRASQEHQSHEYLNGAEIVADVATAAQGNTVVALRRLRKNLQNGGKIAGLLDRILMGHIVRWDGSEFFGVLSPDAQGALASLEFHLKFGDYTF